LEVLAVVVIASAGSAVLLTSLANADQHAALVEVISRWQDMDRRGRLLAQTEGRAIILLADHDGCVLTLRPAREMSNHPAPAPLSQYAWRHGSAVVFAGDSGQQLERIEFDRQGRSIDYTAIVTMDSTLAQRHVCGLTGWVMKQDEPP
jgi:hypothetical protein